MSRACFSNKTLQELFWHEFRPPSSTIYLEIINESEQKIGFLQQSKYKVNILSVEISLRRLQHTDTGR